MKKKILLISVFLVLAFVILLQTNVYATTNTLEEIAEKFNNSNTVNLYKTYNYELFASTSEYEPNVLSITVTNPESESSTISFELNGSVLSNEHLVDEDLMVVILLADSIGQVNGYEDGELFDSFNSEEIYNYTVENEGFEIKENGSYYSVKMDIDKKVPLVDLTGFYLKPEDFDFIKKIIDDNMLRIKINAGTNKMCLHLFFVLFC